MKRDMNLVRKILLFVEALPPGNTSVDLVIAGHSPDEIEYHALMLVERGLLKDSGGLIVAHDELSVFPDALTFEGHDFLGAVRNDTVWRKTMDKVGSAVGSTSLEIIKAVAQSYAKQLLGIS
jgi:hypothetical protein